MHGKLELKFGSDFGPVFELEFFFVFFSMCFVVYASVVKLVLMLRIA